MYEIVTGDILAGGGKGYPVRAPFTRVLEQVHGMCSMWGRAVGVRRACCAMRWAQAAAGAPIARSSWAS